MVVISNVNTVDPKAPLNVTQHAQQTMTSTGVLMPESHVDSDPPRAAQHPMSTDTVPSSTLGPNLPVSDAGQDLQPFTDVTSGSHVVEPNPPLPKAAQHPSTGEMPSLDIVDPKPLLPDAVIPIAQPDTSADISTLSVAESAGNGSSANKIPEPLPYVSGSIVPSVPSNYSPPDKKKNPGILRPGPANTARNICARKWKESHPRGTTADFKTHFDNLSSEARQEYERLAADMKNTSTAGRERQSTVGSS